jgi:DNA repair protein RecN (Recombination protein N)
MLCELHIKDFALVDEIRIEFERGLNVLSGETGAGKSVIVGSIEALLGERADAQFIRSGCDRTCVEGTFDVSSLPEVRDKLSSFAIDLSTDDILLLRREISRNGRNKCSINGNIATVSMLKNLGELLVDIHSQNDHQSLLRKPSHLRLLDAFSDLSEKVVRYSTSYREYVALKREFAQLSASEREIEQQLDLYRFQSAEIEKAGLSPNEEENLKQERNILSNAETLARLCAGVHDVLHEQDNSVLDCLGKIAMDMEQLARIEPSFQSQADSLEAALLELQEISSAVRSYRDGIEFDEERLEQIEQRLSQIQLLKKKYGSTIAEILQFAENVSAKIERIANREDDLKKMESSIENKRQRLHAAAGQISRERKRHAASLAAKIRKELTELGMLDARFEVSISPNELCSTGSDDVEFLISPNPGEELKPLHKIASGGEISRTMLAIKGVLAEADQIPVLIFDEIDVNLGGMTALAVGEKLSTLAASHQILCITHLPQVASAGERQFRVRKQASGKRTSIAVDKLSGDERVAEIVRMLGGKEFADGTETYAKRILRKIRR